jgi:hypothetical protein
MLIDLTNRRFAVCVYYIVLRTTTHAIRYGVACDCGVNKDIQGDSLRRRLSTSCGCNRRKHGQSRNGGTPEYRAYNHAKDRCTNPRNKKYPLYGGRGVCFKFESFPDFLAALGPRPSPEHSLDRFDDGDYARGQVAWSTRSQQRRNQRSMAKANAARRSIEDIRLGYELGVTQRELAGQYHVSQTFISDLLQAAA